MLEEAKSGPSSPRPTRATRRGRSPAGFRNPDLHAREKLLFWGFKRWGCAPCYSGHRKLIRGGQCGTRATGCVICRSFLRRARPSSSPRLKSRCPHASSRPPVGDQGGQDHPVSSPRPRVSSPSSRPRATKGCAPGPSPCLFPTQFPRLRTSRYFHLICIKQVRIKRNLCFCSRSLFPKK